MLRRTAGSCSPTRSSIRVTWEAERVGEVVSRDPEAFGLFYASAEEDGLFGGAEGSGFVDSPCGSVSVLGCAELDERPPVAVFGYGAQVFCSHDQRL